MLHCGYFLVSGGTSGGFHAVEHGRRELAVELRAGRVRLIKIAFYHNPSLVCFLRTRQQQSSKMLWKKKQKRNMLRAKTLPIKIVIIP